MAAVRVLLFGLCVIAGLSGDVFGRGGVGFYGGRYSAGAAAVVFVARGEIGVRETGPNRGPRVDEYNGYVGMKGVAWCASFVSWCFGQVGYGAPRTAWSPALFPSGSVEIAAEAAEPRNDKQGGGIGVVKGKVVPGLVLGLFTSGRVEIAAEAAEPRNDKQGGGIGVVKGKVVPGLVLGIWFPELGRVAHCGIVVRVMGDMVYSVEGNTNPNGGREGYGVFEKVRHRRGIAKFSNWCY